MEPKKKSKYSSYKVDIIMPNYNKAENLLRSIKSVIYQTHKNWRLFIIDDNSNDKSLEKIKKFKNIKKIKLIKLKNNKGPSYCRNLGLKLSKSKLVAFLDSDDYWTNQKLQRQIEFLIENNHDFVYSDYFFEKNGKFISTNIRKNFTYEKFIYNTAINTSTILIKRKVIKSIKFKTTKFEDYIFKCEILRKGYNAFKDKYVSAYYVKTPNSRSQNKLKNLVSLYLVNKKFNKMNIFQNICSSLSISINFLIKYKYF